LMQCCGDVVGSGARLLTEESPDFVFRIVGVADEFGALYRASGLDVPMLLGLRAARRPMVEYSGIVDALWVATPLEVDLASPCVRATDGAELLVQEADVFIPAAVPNVIDATVAPRLQVRLVAEGANNAVATQVAPRLHRPR